MKLAIGLIIVLILLVIIMVFGYRLDVDYDKYEDLKLNHADKTVLAKLNKRERMCSYGLIITICILFAFVGLYIIPMS